MRGRHSVGPRAAARLPRRADQRRVVWCAHNGFTFDFPILDRHLEQHGFEWPKNWVRFDTLPLAKQLIPNKSFWRGDEAAGQLPGRNLGDLFTIATHGQQLENAHDAEADARALVTVWRWLAERANAAEADTPQDTRHQPHSRH